MWSRMPHSLLRILVALLIGVWSPLCCCQAMMLAGSVCEISHSVAAVSDSCCHNCEDRPVSENEHPSSGLDGQHPSDCKSCPSCQGLSSGAGLKIEAGLASVEEQWNAIATIARDVFFHVPRRDDAIVPGRPLWWGSPPYVKANRETLLWHCALTI